MRLKHPDVEEERLCLVPLDEFNGFGDHGIAQFLVFEPRRFAAFHVADAADAIDDGAGVLASAGCLSNSGCSRPVGSSLMFLR